MRFADPNCTAFTLQIAGHPYSNDSSMAYVHADVRAGRSSYTWTHMHMCMHVFLRSCPDVTPCGHLFSLPEFRLQYEGHTHILPRLQLSRAVYGRACTGVCVCSCVLFQMSFLVAILQSPSRRSLASGKRRLHGAWMDAAQP